MRDSAPAASNKTIQDPPVVCSSSDPACRSADINFDQNDQNSGAIDHYGDGVIYNATNDGIQVDTTAGQLNADADNDGVPDIADACPTNPLGWVLNSKGECTDEGVYVELSGTPGAPDASKDVDKTILFDFFKADIYILAEASSDSFLATGGKLADVLTRGTVNAAGDADLAMRLGMCNTADINGKGAVGAAKCILPGSWFGVGQFTDYNINRDNQLYFHMLDMTDNVDDIRRAAQKLTEESYSEDANGALQALWSMTSGLGLGNYLPSRGVCASYTNGNLTGWPCFRPDSVKVAVLLHYAPFHNGPSGAQWTDSTGTVHNIGTYPYGNGSIDNSRAQPANMVPVQVWPQLLYNDGPRTVSSPQPTSERGIYSLGNLTHSVAFNTNTIGNRSTINPAGRFRDPWLVDHGGDTGDCAINGTIHQSCNNWWAQTFTFCTQINGSWIDYNTIAQSARGNAWFYFRMPSSRNVLIHTHGSDRDMALGTFLEGSPGSWNEGPQQLQCNDYGGYHDAISIGNGSGYNETGTLSDDAAAVRRTFSTGGYYAVVSSIGIGGKWPEGGPASRGYQTGDGNIRLTFDLGVSGDYRTTHVAPISYNDVVAMLVNNGVKVVDVPLTLNGACPSTPGWISSWIPTSWTQSLDQLLRLIFFPGTAVGGVLAAATGAVDAGGNPASYSTCAGSTETQLNVLRALRDITQNTEFNLYVQPSRDQTETIFPNFDDRNLIGRIPASATVAQAAAGSALWDIKPKDCDTCRGVSAATNTCTQCLTGANPNWTIHFQNSGSDYDPVSNPSGTALRVDGAPMVRKLWLDMYADPDPSTAGDEVLVKHIPVRVFVGQHVQTPTGTFTLLYDTARDPDPMNPNVGPLCKIPPERPRWQMLEYNAKIPLGTQMQFEFKTANSTPDLMDPTKVTTVTVPVPTNGDFDGTGSIDVNDILPSDAKQLPVLQIQAKLISAPAQVVAAVSPPVASGGTPERKIGIAPSGFTFQVTRMNMYHVPHQHFHWSHSVSEHDEYCALDTLGKMDLLFANSSQSCGYENRGNYQQNFFATTYAVPTIQFGDGQPYGYPGWPGGDASHFATRATADLIVRESGTYQFAILSDDGVRLRIDGSQVYGSDSYIAGERIVSVSLSAGRHTLELMQFQNTGGHNIRLRVNDPTTGWRVLDAIDPTMPGVAEAGFTVKTRNQNVSSIAAAETAINGAGVTRTGDSVINMKDGGGGIFGGDAIFPGDPDGTVNENAAFYPITRATAKLRVPVAGTYKFGVWSDDGVRLRIDGSDVIWNQGCCTTLTGDKYLDEGTHDLEVLNYDSGGGAALELFMLNATNYGGGTWQLIGRAPADTETTMLFLDAGSFVRVGRSSHAVVMGSLTDVGTYFPGMGPYKALIRGAWLAAGKLYFLLQATNTDPVRVARVDWNARTLDGGYPKAFASEFPQLAPYQSLLRSFTPAPNGFIYAHMADGRYLRFDPVTKALSGGYPQAINDASWPVLNTVVPRIAGASSWKYGVDVWLSDGGLLRYDWPPNKTDPWPIVLGTQDIDKVGTFVPTLRQLHFKFFCQEVE
ncbi:MAG: hypothetical protein KC543_01405 [Myxococcales bacterium]|nr:hypothetical protein [Myxococcales bacterium]